jgi:hypothetical protein
VTDRKKIEGSGSTGQRPRWAVVPVEEEEQEQEQDRRSLRCNLLRSLCKMPIMFARF